jgi:hypothetical protein
MIKPRIFMLPERPFEQLGTIRANEVKNSGEI